MYLLEAVHVLLDVGGESLQLLLLVEEVVLRQLGLLLHAPQLLGVVAAQVRLHIPHGIL